MNGVVLALLLAMCPACPRAAPGATTATAFVAAAPAPSASVSEDGGEEFLPIDPEDEFRVVTIDEAAAYHAEGKAIFVDARSNDMWELGHIKGAVNVPESDFDKGYARARARLPLASTLIVYCESSRCDQAAVVLRRLQALGYADLLYYKEGWIIWDWSKKPQEKGAKYRNWR